MLEILESHMHAQEEQAQERPEKIKLSQWAEA